MFDKPIIILGPTATGKTALAIELAERHNGEIISLDSVQLYQGLDVGAAKPSQADLLRIPHHMINCFALEQSSDVSTFINLAKKSKAEIESRGKCPIFAGGTAMYVKALVDGLFEGPGASVAVREELEKLLATKGAAWLHQEVLKIIDPNAAERLHPNDTQRVLRAIEVYKITGKPLSHYQQQWNQKELNNDFIMIGLSMPRELLYQRIEDRVDLMINMGLEEEVKSVMQNGLLENKSASKAIGYKEMIEYLQGQISLERSIELIKRNTRRFAKHQLTWFRKDSRIIWCDISENKNIPLVKIIEQKINGKRASDPPPAKINPNKNNNEN